MALFIETDLFVDAYWLRLGGVRSCTLAEEFLGGTVSGRCHQYFFYSRVYRTGYDFLNYNVELFGRVMSLFLCFPPPQHQKNIITSEIVSMLPLLGQNR